MAQPKDSATNRHEERAQLDQKNRQIVTRAKEYQRQIIAMAQPKELATNCREGRARNRGQQNRQNVARAKRIYDINRR